MARLRMRDRGRRRGAPKVAKAPEAVEEVKAKTTKTTKKKKSLKGLFKRKKKEE